MMVELHELYRHEGREVWGRYVDPAGKPELFRGLGAPDKHVKGKHPPAGIDHMRLRTVDVFRIPKIGEFTVPFDGYFKVVRSEPDTPEFHTATVYVNFVDLKLFGTHETLGNIKVDLNPNVVSAGNTFPARDGANAACRINVAARFHVENLGKVFYNKTPIQLQNDAVQGIPTIGEGGNASVASLPLYDYQDPNGDLFGYVEELTYQVRDYATQSAALAFQNANTFSDYVAITSS